MIKIDLWYFEFCHRAGATARAGVGQSQELAVQFELPTWVTRTQGFEPSPPTTDILDWKWSSWDPNYTNIFVYIYVFYI